MLEHPGPPLNQAASGAFFGSLRASKNQNHIFMFDPTLRYPLYCLTFGVVSQIPEFDTYSSFVPVSECSNTVDLPLPLSSIRDGVPFSETSQAARTTRQPHAREVLSSMLLASESELPANWEDQGARHP
jgi:hypothetical protein